MNDPATSVLNGRLLDTSLTPGMEALVMTSPFLVRALLNLHFANQPESLAELKHRLIGLMDAAEANPVHGMEQGLIEALGAPDSFGFVSAQVAISKQEPLLLTDDAIREALGGPLAGARGHARGTGGARWWWASESTRRYGWPF